MKHFIHSPSYLFTSENIRRVGSSRSLQKSIWSIIASQKLTCFAAVSEFLLLHNYFLHSVDIHVDCSTLPNLTNTAGIATCAQFIILRWLCHYHQCQINYWSFRGEQTKNSK